VLGVTGGMWKTLRNSVVMSSQGMSGPLANRPTSAYRERSSYPEWGTQRLSVQPVCGLDG